MTNYRNTYYVMRHGQSLNNVRRQIVATIESGRKMDNGLTDQGRQEAKDGAEAMLQYLPGDSMIIFASDFLRTKQTATIVAETFGIETIKYDEALRERKFGAFEGQFDDTYYAALQGKGNYVDKLSTVETLEEIMGRIQPFIDTIEQNYQDKIIILVSHGDTIRAIDGVLQDLTPPIVEKIPMPRHGQLRSSGGNVQGKYPNAFYRVSLKAIIKNGKGEVLCVKEDGGDWSLPGGGIDHEEDERTALRRELEEEVALSSTVEFTTRLLGVDSMFLYTQDAWLMWVVYEVTFGKLPKFEVGKDADELAWLDPTRFKTSTIRTEQLIYKWCVDRSHAVRRK